MTRVAVIGAGISGLASAFRLTSAGYDVTVYEQCDQPGGLAASIELGGVPVGRNYHFICGPDQAYLDLLGELGLGSKVHWGATRMGSFRRGRYRRFGTPLSLLRYDPIAPLDRLRFALSSARSRSRTSWRELDDVSARDWLIAEQGPSSYEAVWKPLLEQKFGPAAHSISAAWMWARINRVANSRAGLLGKERLGYLEGGELELVQALVARIREAGGRIRLSSAVDSIDVEGRVVRGVRSGGVFESYDVVVSTVATPVFMQLVGRALAPDEQSRLLTVDYHDITCWVLLAREPLGPDFWLNIDDPRIPFPGVTTMTHLDPMPELSGHHVLYVPMYLPPGDPRWDVTHDEGIADVLAALDVVSPGFSAGVVESRLTRDRFAQPIYDIGFASRLGASLAPATTVEGLFRTDMSMVYPHDRSLVNAVSEATRIETAVLGRAPL